MCHDYDINMFVSCVYVVCTCVSTRKRKDHRTLFKYGHVQHLKEKRRYGTHWYFFLSHNLSCTRTNHGLVIAWCVKGVYIIYLHRYCLRIYTHTHCTYISIMITLDLTKCETEKVISTTICVCTLRGGEKEGHDCTYVCTCMRETEISQIRIQRVEY